MNRGPLYMNIWLDEVKNLPGFVLLFYVGPEARATNTFHPLGSYTYVWHYSVQGQDDLRKFSNSIVELSLWDRAVDHTFVVVNLESMGPL